MYASTSTYPSTSLSTSTFMSMSSNICSSNSLKSIKRQERKSLRLSDGDTLPFLYLNSCLLFSPISFFILPLRHRFTGPKVRKEGNSVRQRLSPGQWCWWGGGLQMIYRPIVEFKSEEQRDGSRLEGLVRMPARVSRKNPSFFAIN